MNRKLKRDRGFSVLELMVAIAAGAIAISAIYSMSAAASRHFRTQQRLAMSQLNLRMAMEQLRRDFALAGYLGSPNSRREQRCLTTPREVQAVELVDSGGTANLPLAGTNGVTADTIRLTGNYSTSDGYLVRSISATGNRLFFQTAWQGFRRSFGVPFDEDRFDGVFQTGRTLHMETIEGNHFFLVIAAPSAADTSVQFAPTIAVGGACLGGLGEGAVVAPLTRIEYAVLAPGDASLSSLNNATSPVAGINGPTLVRREVAFDGTATPVVNSERVVAEYVAEFDVDFMFDQQNLPTGQPIIQRLDDGAAQAALASAATPHRARTAIIRLSVRSPQEDSRHAYAVRTGALTHYELNPVAVGSARVRTLESEVMLTNIAQRNMRP